MISQCRSLLPYSVYISTAPLVVSYLPYVGALMKVQYKFAKEGHVMPVSGAQKITLTPT